MSSKKIKKNLIKINKLKSVKTNIRHNALLKKLSDNLGTGMTMEQAMIAVGYTPSYAKSGNIKTTKNWPELVEQEMSDEYLMGHHKQLMNSRRLEHMVFPLRVTDEQMTEMLASVNCTVKRIMHGEQQNHAWYWANDNRAKKDALDMMYKIKNRYDNTINIKGKLDGVSDAEIENRIAGIISGVIGSLARKRKEGEE